MLQMTGSRYFHDDILHRGPFYLPMPNKMRSWLYFWGVGNSHISFVNDDCLQMILFVLGKEISRKYERSRWFYSLRSLILMINKNFTCVHVPRFCGHDKVWTRDRRNLKLYTLHCSSKMKSIFENESNRPSSLFIYRLKLDWNGPIYIGNVLVGMIQFEREVSETWNFTYLFIRGLSVN